MAKRDVETATIAVAAFNGDVKEEEDLLVLFCSSPFKSACVSDDDRGDMMMMSDDNTRAYKFLPRLSKSQEKKKIELYILGCRNTP